MNTVAFNGKFLTAPPTGVHRVAGSLIQSVDEILQSGARQGAKAAWELLCPPDVRRSLPTTVIASHQFGPLTWQFWEQFQLPLRTRNTLLVNLCNLAPLAHRGGVTMIHDAQVFISPESYSQPFYRWYQFALPKIGLNAAKILTVSEYSRQQLAHYGVAPLSKIVTIHNGVDHLLSEPSEPEIVQRLELQPAKYVVALANTQPHKNIGILLRAFGDKKLASVPLVLVGSATAADFEATGAAVPKNAVFAGRVSDGGMRALLEDAACLAFPSTTEGFGLPPLEAMLLGCPAVVAPCGALPEVCGDSAIYVDPNDEAGWVEAIAALVEGGELRDRASARGRQHASRFTWRRAGEQLLGVIDDLLASTAGQFA
jgi:glycosyltransferase involved in cell wall biosynthesis